MVDESNSLRKNGHHQVPNISSMLSTTGCPHGMRKYLEVNFFPRIQLKAGNGISICTAHRWSQREGYTEHKKSLYYDGHDRPDVLTHHQNEFLPRMLELRPQLVDTRVVDM